ncbi:hypothetical protein B0H14DRAFT_2590387 [Mycena olivaceomarginata]|nr:hypothetical protein B0H14DRAFT_2590387 [Mycena olivaceomarginata]
MTLIALRTILTKTQLPPREFTSTCPASEKTDADNLMAASLQYQQVLRRKGRMAARIISPFAHWAIVLSAGLKRDPSRDDEGSDRFTDKQIRQQLRDGKIVPGPADYNRGLYHGHDPDPNDLVSGFLHDDEIVRAYNHIFISPTTALAENGAGDKSTGKGNAAQHDMSEATLESIYYVVHINTFQAAGNNGLFSYRKYFNFLQHSVRLWPEADQKSLLTWWNEKVFSHRSEAQPAKRADGSLSIAERMAAQAAAAKAAISRLESM